MIVQCKNAVEVLEQQGGGEVVYGLFRAIVDAGGPETIARHGVERGSREWVAKVRAGLLAIERQFHPERFDEPAPSAPVGVAYAWQEGYRQGVLDERTSEANIGVAGFGAKIEPARNNPYLAPAGEVCAHDWCIWPETDGYEQKCLKCGEHRKTPKHERDAATGTQPPAGAQDKWKALIGKWQQRAEAAGYDGIEGALEAAEAQAQGGVVVTAKPLEWQEDGPGEWCDRHHGFHITQDDEEPEESRFTASWGECDPEFFPTLDEAQAWCQESIDRYIREWAITAPPSAPVGVEGLRYMANGWLAEAAQAEAEKFFATADARTNLARQLLDPLATQHQEPKSCKHYFVRDEDNGGECCQLCGEVKP